MIQTEGLFKLGWVSSWVQWCRARASSVSQYSHITPLRKRGIKKLCQGVWRRHLRNHDTRQTQPKKPVPTARVHPSGNRLEQHPTVVGAVAVERQVVLGRLVVDQVVHEEVGRLAPGDDLARVGVHGGGGGLGAHPRTMDATCRPENQLLIIILAKNPRRAFATVKKQRKKPLTRGLGPVFLMVLYDCSVELGPALSSSARRG